MDPWTLSLLAGLTCLAVGLVAQYSLSMSLGGVSIQKSINRTGDHANAYEVTLPVGKAGTLSTRTDNDTGVVTATAHGLIVGDKVNVFWSGGKRYGMTVSAVADANNATVGTLAGEIGAGDNFPVQGTAVVITKQVTINAQIDGDAIAIIGIVAEAIDPASTAKAHLDLLDAGGLSIEAIDLVANEPKTWDITGGATNVFTGNPITSGKAANGSSTEALTLKLLSLEDSTP